MDIHLPWASSDIPEGVWTCYKPKGIKTGNSYVMIYCDTKKVEIKE